MVRPICQIVIRTTVPTSWEPNTVDVGESTVIVAKLGLGGFFCFQTEHQGLCFCNGIGWANC